MLLLQLELEYPRVRLCSKCILICTLQFKFWILCLAAGIPDFRSKDTGIYENLDEYNLPDPMAVFSIDYFEVFHFHYNIVHVR